jgi:hypothetical protein
MKPYLISLELERLEANIEALQKEKTELIHKTIEGCKHPLAAIRERPYVPSATSYGNSQPPYLVCTACGLSEKGWGCGYKKLRHAENKNVKQITTKEWAEVSLRLEDD